ncbi:hypothetical protein, conserved [Trypanosoma brucei gambiense DAL972]|uniref:Uncharacterized protein n=2 Tax=Trypanosoma brucei TaxID=5691 RepID=C9ZTF2_TRYB9|nr:hypothetical protein, conserved [Trypanosoma brucei gambiense DAL972]RHW71364.1 hypothetical protein DPX39_070061700 [Trypanosoma brucei equiperdum]CBH12687.1 hypothetical protein, conserved [Trypanosoma brucei gambiense DAL972]|eukprot:XP_011774967.1 hypothetical protein, conserved [Trypanosoma brucei gambiense DAL972]
MAFSLPKKYYLIVHDAIRKVLGNDAEISAFVTSQGKFQCHMLVNSTTTDPDLSNTVTGNPVGGSAGNADKKGEVCGFVKDFAARLQRCLGVCDIVACRRRLDIVFMDREVLRLALGAPRRAINNLRHPCEINEEPDWTRRNRLRISLGFDEDLFIGVCDLKIALAARLMERWVYDKYCKGNVGKLKGESAKRLLWERQRHLYPPVTYWQAHGYLLSQEYPCDHHITLVGTIAQNFAKYYGEFPLDNPYCPGEDLNTIGCVQELCRAWKQLPVDEGGAEVLLKLGVEPPVTQ